MDDDILILMELLTFILSQIGVFKMIQDHNSISVSFRIL